MLVVVVGSEKAGYVDVTLAEADRNPFHKGAYQIQNQFVTFISYPKNIIYKLPNLIDPLIDKCSLVFLNILSLPR